MKEYLKDFMDEAEEHLQKLNATILILEKSNNDMEAINQLFRSSHTLKSSSAAMGFNDLSNLAHKMEDVLGRLRNKEIKADTGIINVLFKCVDALSLMTANISKGSDDKIDASSLLNALENIMKIKQQEFISEAETAINLAERPEMLKAVESVKVDIKKMDKLVDIVGELIINKLGLEHLKLKFKDLDKPLMQMDKLIQDLQFEVMQARMVPVEQIFNKFPRMVRDLALKENKEIEILIEGSEITLDRTVLDQIGEPLVHLLRNAVDHGIESNEERKALGKKRGAIKLSAKRERNSVVIIVEDDGRGFDTELIKKVAVDKGIITKEGLAGLSPDKLLKLPFSPGFSTSKIVTEISGRGVGLDTAKNKIESLGGTIRLETEKGKGSKFMIELPLTLAIVQCFLIKVYSEIYAIPISNVVRSARIRKDEISTIENNEVIIFENTEIPLIRIGNLFNLEAGMNGNGKNGDDCVLVMIIEKAGERAGLVVDNIIGKQEIIIKPLGKFLKHVKGFAGATILGDGNPALILDVATLV